MNILSTAHFIPSSPFAVAVSGGADSMALLLLAAEWAEKHGTKAIALTVDHGLRKESTQEAKQVAVWCKARGIEHYILTWEHESPPPLGGRPGGGHYTEIASHTMPPPQPSPYGGGSVQAWARTMRYALLTNWCKQHNISQLLTAHHRGDQAETLFFRLARGSTLRGLACMQAVTEMRGIRLLRPLLSTGKKELMQYLTENNQPWIEDPSNRNLAHTRNAIRARLESLPDANEIEQRAAAVAQAFSRIRAALDAKTEEAFRAAVTPRAHDCTIDARAFAKLAPEIALLLTGQLICRYTGDDHPPRTEKLKRLCGWLAKPATRRATLAHMVFEHRPKEGVFRVYPAAQPLEKAA